MKTITSILFILLFVLFASFIADAKAKTIEIATVEVHCVYDAGYLDIIIHGNRAVAKFNDSISYKPVSISLHNDVLALLEIVNGNTFTMALNLPTMTASGRTVFDSGRTVTSKLSCSIKNVPEINL